MLIMPGKRLPKDIISFIKAENRSYRVIREEIKSRWNLEIPKSTISYYKKRKPRIKPMNLEGVTSQDWQWFQGLFAADGNKIVCRDTFGPHYIVRIGLDNMHDLPIAEKCIRIIKAVGLTPNKLLWGNCLTIKISSKQLYHKLNKIVEKSTVTPAYIAGAIDGDGWVDHRAIQFGQSHVPELFNGISNFFTEHNIQIGVWTKSDELNYRRMYIPFSVLKSTEILSYSIKAQRII
jgi:hypothetical protein